jgi:dienelactone hydrolase
LPGILSAQAADIRTSQVTLQTASGAIRADLFEPQRQTGGVIVVLHGAGGMLFDGPEMRRVSRHLAAAGNTVYLLHYFNRTGTVFALDRTMEKNFGLWRETVHDSIISIREMRGSASPVGIYGYSLGGFLALFTASDNPAVGAVVTHAGGVWKGKADRIRKMPPVLVVHGEQDMRVAFEKYAKPLVTLLRSRRAVVETRFFANEGHVFTQPAMAIVREDAAKFFRRHLR